MWLSVICWIIIIFKSGFPLLWHFLTLAELLCAYCCLSLSVCLRMSWWKSWRSSKRIWMKASMIRMEKKLWSFVAKCWPLDHIPIPVRIPRRAFSWFLQFAVLSTNSRRLLGVLFCFFFLKVNTDEENIEDDLEYLRRWATAPCERTISYNI